MYLEGKNAIRQALEAKKTIVKIYIDKNFAGRKDEIFFMASQNKVKIEFVPRTILDKKSKTGHHQGYLAETVDFNYSSLDDILQKAKDKNQMPFIVILDCIEDPHNFGAIIRSCECAGVHGIIIPKDRACPVNETVVRTSTGAVSEMLIAKVVNIRYAIDVVIGSEGNGIRPSIISSCDGVLTLPLMGKVNSLNASVACGITIFEILRQRLK